MFLASGLRVRLCIGMFVRVLGRGYVFGSVVVLFVVFCLCLRGRSSASTCLVFSVFAS